MSASSYGLQSAIADTPFVMHDRAIVRLAQPTDDRTFAAHAPE